MNKLCYLLLSENNMYTFVYGEGQISDQIKTSLGVQQGCLLSPLLFLLVLDGVLRRALDGKKRGLTWRLKESLEDMEYADDICLVSHKYEHIKKKLNWMISGRNLRE